ncbi:nSTAND1 domain-containing NTPase [Streptomyces erythrochromogenes]|uniref:nSTAND1 domain-containing NTPase n=1 Tax=Streptomyces erythrochromogenes TaxID=285574 RepID=UPI003806E98B
MPRPERPLDPDSGPLTQFAADLRKLREAAGRPPYRALAKRAHYSSTTLSDAAGGHALPSLAVTLAYVEACRGDRRAWETRWHTAAAEIAATAHHDEPAATDHLTAPYAGLAAFQPEDADRFFGREQLTAELLAKVRDHRFLTVFGPSGSGKSSLLRAGLVARTRTAGAPVILFTPGPHPVEECAVHLAAATGEAPGPLLTELRSDPATLHLRIRQTALAHPPATGPGPGADILIVVDQFEEVFTLCQDQGERDAFITMLIEAAATPTSRTRVVLGVRADFYGHCVQHPRLVEAMRDAQIAVGPMTGQELREAVTRPAALADCTVTGPLLAAVVADATGQPGALPLVSHAMVETWRRRCGSRLTLDGYLAAGGIRHALAHTAEAAYAALSPAQQEHARSLFLRLTALGDGTEDTRRRITTNELDPGPDTAHVLESLARRRLVTLDDGCVEITHEAIIRCWPRLRGWLTEDRDRLLLHRRLTDATADWEAQGHDPHTLYRGARLAAALDLAAARDSRLTAKERRFLDAAREAQAGETAAARQRTVRLRQLVTLLTVLVAVAATAGALAVDSRDSAIRQRNVAIARKAAADAAEVRRHDPALAAQLNLAAHRLAATHDVRDQLMSTFATPYTSRLTGHTSDVVSISVAPGSTLLATASWDRTARLWDIEDAHHPVQLAAVPQSERLVSVAFDPTGRVLATAGDRSVRLWDVTNRRAPTQLASLPSLPGLPTVAPSWVAYGPAGSGILATGHTDGTTRLWNADDPRRPRLLATLHGHTAAITSVAFSPDRHTMATTGDTTTRLWEVGDPAHPLLLDVLRGHTDTVTSSAFSPDGTILATGGWDRTARVWHLAAGRRTQPAAVLPGHPAIVWSVAFSPDGTTLVTVGGATHFWDVTTPAAPRRTSTIQGGFYQAAFTPDGRVLANSDRLLDLRDLSLATHDDVVTSLAFAPGGRLLASASWDGTARLWQVTGGRALWPLSALPGHTRFVRCVTFSPDGRTLVTASEDGTARVWNVTDPRRPRLASVISPEGGEVGGTAFAPDGRLLAVWAQATAGLWDLTDPADPRRLSRITEDGRHVTTASFRPDGRTLVTSTGESGSLTFWDITRPRTPRELPSPLRSIPLTGAVFSPDNRRLAAFHRTDKTVWLIDVHDIHHPAQTTRLPASGSWIYTLAFDAAGHRLAAGAADGKALLWDLDGPAAPTAPTVLTGHANPVPAVAFSPDGTTLATGGNDFTLRLRDTRLKAVTTRICDSAHPRITRAQWAQHFPALDFTPPCPAR